MESQTIDLGQVAPFADFQSTHDNGLAVNTFSSVILTSQKNCFGNNLNAFILWKIVLDTFIKF